MGKDKSWVDNNHYRTTSDDGKTSYLYEAGFWSDTCVEIAEHHSDGTTDAYEVGGVLDSLFNGCKGDHK
ncbi:MAG: hypothetical protein ACK46Q_07545 [Hyphomonas sp.]